MTLLPTARSPRAGLEPPPSRPHELVFLCGAGVSLDPPSSFPIATTIIEEIVREISPDRAAHDHLRRLCDPRRDDKHAPGDYLRFELLLDVLSDWIDPELRVLDFVREIKKPNDLHLLIASLGVRGATIITTNFDSLFEAAILELGSEPVTLCMDEDFLAWRTLIAEDRVPVFKIHGSFSRFSGSRVEPAKESIEATLAQVSRGVTGLVLTEPKASFLNHALAGKHLVVAGYSGSDDLDVMPTLLQMKSISFTWIQHDLGEPREVSRQTLSRIRSMPKEFRAVRDSFFLRHLRGSSPARIVGGPTRQILRHWFGGPSTEETGESNRFSLRQFIEDWGRATLRPVDRKLLLAEIYFRLSRFPEALALLDEVLRDEDDLGEDTSRILSTYSNALIQGGRLTEGLEVAQRSVRCLPSTASARVRIRARRHLAFSLFRNGRHSEARPLYEECLKLAVEQDLADEAGSSAHDLALIHLDLGHLTAAETLFEQSIRLSGQAGDLRHVGWSHFQLGVLHYERGDFAVAESRFLESERIASTVGDVNHLAFVDHEVGLLHFLRGELALAARRFRSALRTDRRTGSDAFSGMDHQHLGIVFLEVGRWRSAEHCFNKARECYEQIGDRETLSELRSYLAQLRLLEGRIEESIEEAARAVEEADRDGLPQFRRRARFLHALCRVAGRRAEKESLLVPIDDAAEAQQIPLILDLVYLTFQTGRGDILKASRPDLVSWVRRIYDDLGNARRLATITAA